LLRCGASFDGASGAWDPLLRCGAPFGGASGAWDPLLRGGDGDVLVHQHGVFLSLAWPGGRHLRLFPAAPAAVRHRMP